MEGDNPLWQPTGYRLLHQRGPGAGHAGGVAMLIRNNIPYTVLTVQTDLQVIAVRLQLDRLYTICSIYIPPNSNLTLTQMQNLTRQLPEPCLILGDYNARSPLWGDTTTNAAGTTIMEFLERSNKIVLNHNFPTHYSMAYDTLSNIDLSLCSAEVRLQFDWCVSRDLYDSDHFPILLKPITDDLIQTNKRFLFEKADWTLFQTRAIPTQQVDDFESINDAVQHITECIISAAEEAIPKTSGTLRPKVVPWWCAELQQAKQIKQRALYKYIAQHTPANREAYNRARAHFRALRKRKRKESWINYVSSINSDTRLDKIWQKIHRLNGKYKTTSPPILKNAQGDLVADPVEVAEMFGASLENISRGSAEPQFTRISQQCRPPNFRGGTHETYNNVFSLDELNHALRDVVHTAPGEDQVSYTLLKHLPNETLDYILKLYNRIWTTHRFPVDWLIAIVLPFEKPEKDPYVVTNYRPISLTSCLCKLMEKMVNVRLVWTLEKRQAISSQQYGFRHGRSTTDVLVRLDTDIKHAFARRQHTIVVFFDLQKAYDTTWRHGILQRLHEVGIRGHLPVFLSNFLSNRTFKVKVGQSLSSDYTQYQGVPQGSVLSCTLFSLAISELANNIPQNTNCTLYVDDFTIYASGSHLPTLTRRVQLALNQAHTWLVNHGFTVNRTKTKAMHFTKLRGLFPPPELRLDTTPVAFVEEMRFLGMIFDRKLSWQPHLRNLRQRCLTAMNILKTISRKSWGADRASLFHIYRMLVRSKLDYGCQIYSSAPKSTLQILNPVHHLGIRLCTGAFRTSPVESLYCESGEPSLEDRRRKLSLQLYARLSGMPRTPAHVTVFDDSNDHRLDPPLVHTTFGYRMRQLNLYYPTLPEMNSIVLPTINLNYAPWCLSFPPPCARYIPDRRNDVPARALRLAHENHRNTHHSNQIHIYTDGSKTADGVGCSVVAPDRTDSRRLVGISSIFTAELTAIYIALARILQIDHHQFVIFSDSMSAIRGISDKYTSNPLIKSIHYWISTLSAHNKSIHFCWTPSHVGIPGNERADELAKTAITNLPINHRTQVPMRDLYPAIKTAVWADWERRWTAIPLERNKLRQVKPSIQEFVTSYNRNRQCETLLTRLRIGHTLLTHIHLRRGEDVAVCNCALPLSVKHILTECPDYRESRIRIYGRSGYPDALNLKDMLADSTIATSKIFRFLSDADLIHHI